MVHLCRNNLLGVVLWKIPVFLGSAQSLEPSVLQARHKLSCNQKLGSRPAIRLQSKANGMAVYPYP